MILSGKTFMNSNLIKNCFNNISGLRDVLEDYGYEWLDYILDDLEFVYNSGKEDYLMNITTTGAIQELIKISEDWNITNSDYPIGNYEKIGCE